jgi:mannitol-1-phosphate/altronate dehydrogenase
MKLLLLNGSHQLMSYLGLLAGHRYANDVMADADLGATSRRQGERLGAHDHGVPRNTSQGL